MFVTSNLVITELHLKSIIGKGGEMVRWLQALVAVAKDPGLFSSIHNHPWLQFQETHYYLLTNMGTVCTWCSEMHVGKHSHI